MESYSEYSDAMILAEIEQLSERYWDLLAQVNEARLAKAALLNALQSRRKEGGN